MQPGHYKGLNASEDAERWLVLAIYVLYSTAVLTAIFGPIAGLVLALWQRNKAVTELGKSHIANQISIAQRCFLLFLLGSLLLITTSLVMYSLDLESDYNWLLIPGIVALLASIFWFLITSVIGMGRVLGGNRA